ncbi:SGNH hydrolase superfamily [Sesbania bispinosa]|nr:SGNH hydrolase superfamily [Sesbania bispinosa]
MTFETRPWLVLPLLLLIANCMQHYSVHGESKVPCLFIFGDSLSDNGNNNNLVTTTKSNYKPYGIDFPTGPTGRFTNGPTAIDIITLLLEFKDFIPPYANISGSDILKGVNYASGAAGIRVESGKHMGDDISLGLQITHHLDVVSKIAIKLGGLRKAKEYLNKCLYYVNIGSNDYINNYFLPQFYPTSYLYSPQKYAEVLINQLSLYLQNLHDVGARKFVTVGVGLIGCTPNAISTRGTNGSCVEEENADAFIFNDNLKSLVDLFNIKFSADSKFIFINSTAGTIDPSFGFTVFDVACCPTADNGLCIRDQMPCENRNEYVFWDEFHPTTVVNLLTAIASYNASNPAFTYPMDIEHLVQS